MQPNRTGKETTEYRVTILSIVVALIGALAPFLQAAVTAAPPNSLFAIVGGAVVVAASAIVGGTYNISRGMAKKDVPPEQQQKLILKEAQKIALEQGATWIRQELARQLTGGKIGGLIGATGVLGSALEGVPPETAMSGSVMPGSITVGDDVESFLSSEDDPEYEQNIQSFVAQTVQAQEAQHGEY